MSDRDEAKDRALWQLGVAFEAGYKAHERGENFQLAMEKFRDLIAGKYETTRTSHD